ncbi:hypothetical protein TTRE_0000832901 [Trichuris trichiura]|uniref:Uncharacterized protein n=1 Tax=Trichuris trichiura TaxID=36087 RepID=A0A077ZHV7_TRITR|nr:hypothetical protein TTRE_0000832901 [Trichuris trichiura]
MHDKWLRVSRLVEGARLTGSRGVRRTEKNMMIEQGGAQVTGQPPAERNRLSSPMISGQRGSDAFSRRHVLNLIRTNPLPIRYSIVHSVATASLRYWISKVEVQRSISPVGITVITVSSAGLAHYVPLLFAFRPPPQPDVADSDSRWPFAATKPLQKQPKVFCEEASPKAFRQSLPVLGSIGEKIRINLIQICNTYLSVTLEKHRRRQKLQISHFIGHVHWKYTTAAKASLLAPQNTCELRFLEPTPIYHNIRKFSSDFNPCNNPFRVQLQASISSLYTGLEDQYLTRGHDFSCFDNKPVYLGHGIGTEKAIVHAETSSQLLHGMSE